MTYTLPTKRTYFERARMEREQSKKMREVAICWLSLIAISSGLGLGFGFAF